MKYEIDETEHMKWLNKRKIKSTIRDILNRYGSRIQEAYSFLRMHEELIIETNIQSTFTKQYYFKELGDKEPDTFQYKDVMLDIRIWKGCYKEDISRFKCEDSIEIGFWYWDSFITLCKVII